MEKISKVSLYNLLKENALTTLVINQKVTILTGHNGVGKSTLLASLHSSISLMNEGEHIFPRSDWASKIDIGDTFSFNHFKLTSLDTKNPNDELSSLISKYSGPDKLGKIFEALKVIPSVKKNETLVLSTEGEKRDSKAKNLFYSEIRFDKDGKVGESPGTSSILYCDELFSFNVSQEEADIEELDIFSKKNTLDKTLYFLINKLSSTSSANKELHEISEMITKINRLLNKKGMLDNATKNYIKSFMELQGTINHGRHSEFFKEANIFFSMTGRELILNEKNLLSLKINKYPNKKIEWFNLSKGEKTLLCLLLAAYLNNSDHNVFLLDEPDLSLHIQWQKQLIKSLVALAPDSQFIISTHSPALIGHIADETIINISSLIKN